VLPIAVDTHSTAYHVGEVVGLAIVIGLAALVIRRALTRGFGAPSALPRSESSFSGLAVGSVDVSPSPHQQSITPTKRGRGPRDLVIVAIAVVLAGAYVASSISSGLLDSGPAGPWSTSEGVNLRAGFIAGCGKGVSSTARTCECVFARLSSAPPYNTPKGFELLRADFQSFEQTRDASTLPAVVFSSVRSCSG
jgi:hypothetical protein